MTGASTVQLLDVDPALGSGLAPVERERARAALVVRAISRGPGIWRPQDELEIDESDLGVLLLEGLMVRDVEILKTTCAELIGPRDLIRPLVDVNIGAPVPSDVVWHVLSPVRLALLDRSAAAVVGRWPELMSALVGRSVGRAQTVALGLAISSITGLTLRLLVLLWHLADRFGTVTPDGVTVPVPLTHETLAHLVGATRPSVSGAMKELQNGGQLARRSGAPGYVLLGEPPMLRTPVSSATPA
ncbi:MAG TPA: helix-turn-helix domain-containing protein [Thermoleophilaceae bacterium]